MKWWLLVLGGVLVAMLVVATTTLLLVVRFTIRDRRGQLRARSSRRSRIAPLP